MEKIAIHENAQSETVVFFRSLSDFTKKFKTLHENGDVWGVYMDDGEIVATVIGGDTIKNILK